MFLTIDEMRSVLYEYQMDEIAEQDDDILQDGIDSAVEEVRSYLAASNERRYMATLTPQQFQRWKDYDLDAVFAG